MTNPPYEILTREDWVFSLEVDGNKYRAIWMNYIRPFDSHEEHRLVIEKDGVEVSSYNNEENVAAIIEAVCSYRIRQVQDGYNIKNNVDFYGPNRKENMKKTILDLAARSWEDEYLGQHPFGFLYMETVAKILGVDIPQVGIWISELTDEKKLGLNGAILISYEEYEASLNRWEEHNGHKDFHTSDQGDWKCWYCEAGAFAEDELDPKNFECIEGKYKKISNWLIEK